MAPTLFSSFSFSLSLLLLLLLLRPTSAATGLEDAMWTLRVHGYGVFGDLAAAVLPSCSTNGPLTLLTPPNSALFSDALHHVSKNKTLTVCLHVIPKPLSLFDLLNVSYSSTPYLSTAITGHFVRVTSAGDTVTIDGARLSLPDVYVYQNITVHGLKGMMLSAMYTGPPHPLLTSDTQELRMRKLQEGENDMNILGKIWSSVFSILPSSPSTIITIVVVLVSCLSLTLFGSKILKNLLIRLLPFVTKEQLERVKAECMEEIHNLVGNLGELDAKVAEFEVKLEDFGRGITLRIDQVGSKIDELNTTTASLRESLDETNIRLKRWRQQG